MPRVASTLFVLALLAATAVAFAVTEGAKLAHSPISGTSVTPVFSPACAHPCGDTDRATIRFRLRTAERIDVWVERSGHRVRTLASHVNARRGFQTFVWRGRTDSGLHAPDGPYAPAVKLERSHRTIVLPSTIVIDTRPPVVSATRGAPRVISPDGDGHADRVTVPYSVNEAARAILLVNGKRVELTYRKPLHGTLVWDGRLRGRSGLRPAAPGLYRLAVSARDVAGNVAAVRPAGVVQVRYLVAARTALTVAAGTTFALLVSTDAPKVEWRLNGAVGAKARGTLHFRAPAAPGVYRLYLTVAKRHSVVVAVTVR